MIRSLVVALASLVAAAAAFAQTAPSGWQVKATQQSWIATSPAQANGDRVRLVFYPVAKVSGGIDAWFNAEVTRRTAGMGTLLDQEDEIGRETEVGLSPLLRRLTAHQVSGQTVVAVNYGFETSKGRQFMQVVMPERLGGENAAYNAGLDQVAGAWRAGVVYRFSAPAAPPAAKPLPPVAAKPAPAPTPPVAGTGKNCRREPVWGFRLSPFCQPSGICPDRVIKDYETVCD